MNALIEFYHHEARQRPVSQDWLSAHRERALQDLAQMGFPTHHTEDWRYTRMDLYYQTGFNTLTPSPASGRGEQIVSNPQHRRGGQTVFNPEYGREEPTGPHLQGGTEQQDLDFPYQDVVTLAHGAVHIPETLLKHYPAGVEIKPLSVMLHESPELIRSVLDTVLPRTHAFQALNSAMLHEGIVMMIPEGVQVEKPIVLRHWHEQPKQAVYYRHLVIAGKGSSATVIEEYSSDDDTICYTNVMTEVILESQARLTHYKIQREGRQALHTSHVSVRTAADALFQSHVVSTGSRIGRCDTTCSLEGAHAQCLFNGMYAARGETHLDHHTDILHHVPMCESQQDYKGIVDDQAHAVFNGKVYVASGAMHTTARQYNKNLLLSPHAAVDTKPQFEIFADDVTCTHGATVGFLDKETLFYLQARGIEEDDARCWLEQAFSAENVDRISDPLLKTWILDKLSGSRGIPVEPII